MDNVIPNITNNQIPVGYQLVKNKPFKNVNKASRKKFMYLFENPISKWLFDAGHSRKSLCIYFKIESVLTLHRYLKEPDRHLTLRDYLMIAKLTNKPFKEVIKASMGYNLRKAANWFED